MHRFLIVLLMAFLFGCSQKNQQLPNHFVTWEGIGPDKWASIWLIKRHINPEATIQWIPVASVPSTGVVFDIPGSPFYRGKTTTFAQLSKAFGKDTALEIKQFIDIIHDIEITPWGGLRSENSPVVELAFRGLQQTYGRENINESCYLQLFDTVFDALKNKQSLSDPALIIPSEECQKMSAARPDKFSSVPLMEIKDILLAIQKGKKVVFLDAREAEEFVEGHIPGAENIPLRDVDMKVADRFKDADIVVPYCIKDFRGYEVARKLTQYGLNNTVIMQPFGLKGWSDLKLPLQGSEKLTQSEAQAAFERCIQNPEYCVQS